MANMVAGLGELLKGFDGPEIDSQGAEVGGAGRLRRTADDIFPPSDLESYESRRIHNRSELCFQQSASDSTCPGINL